ncbi:MAG TPA: CsbD family protein [Candidatus Polarisedimenticolia bacterium]|nr:CsbD family protein [Candidatus Polarisedimenticolia bacterium]
MNWDTIKGNWKQFAGLAKQKWGKLTDDELMQVAGHRDAFIGKLQEKYGLSKDEAERQIGEFESSATEEHAGAVKGPGFDRS